MKKEFRIKKNEEFQGIIRHRKFKTSKNFIVYTKKKSEENSRVGISVPKKTGNAATRNKIKRQVREIIRPLYKESWNFDMIIIVKKTYLNESFEDNKKDLENLLKQVKI